VVHVPVRATSPAAPAAIRAVLVAASPAIADAELEPAALDDGVLARWRREPSRDDGDPRPDAYDGRWLWAVALAFVVGEGIVRRRGRVEAEQRAHADAA